MHVSVSQFAINYLLRFSHQNNIFPLALLVCHWFKNYTKYCLGCLLIKSVVRLNDCAQSNHMSRIVRKPSFCICENKDADQLAKPISAFVFTTLIVQSLYFLNTKFQASSHLLCLYSLVCVGPGRKPRRPVFSQRGSYNNVIRSLPSHIPKWFPMPLILQDTRILHSTWLGNKLIIGK